MQAMEEWTAIYTELLFRNINILCNSFFFFGQSQVMAIKHNAALLRFQIKNEFDEITRQSCITVSTCR